jgi:hypothetical protein
LQSTNRRINRMITTISTLPEPPSRNNPATFSDKADALLGAMPTLVTELNAFVSEVNTLSFKTACKAATTTAITLSGTQTIDGQSILAGDRVLVKNQASLAQNGIYTASINAWTRAPDMDTVAEVAGSFVPITYGVANGGKIFYTTFNATGATLGTTEIPWNSLTEASVTGIGTVGVANGGTGIASYAVGDLIYASGTTTLVKLAAAASGNVLKSGTAPSWGKVALASDVSGTLPVANGGTGITSTSSAAGVGFLSTNGTGGWIETTLPGSNTTTSGIVQLATDAEIVAGTLNSTKAITPATLRSGALYRSSINNLTNTTGYTWSTIPSWVKRITVVLAGISATDSGANTGMHIQLGTSASGLITSGYTSHLGGINSGTGQYSFSNGFGFWPVVNLPASVLHGNMVIHIDNTNGIAVATGINMYTTGAGAMHMYGGILTYSSTIDRIRVSTTNTNTFDAGYVTFIFE